EPRTQRLMRTPRCARQCLELDGVCGWQPCHQLSGVRDIFGPEAQEWPSAVALAEVDLHRVAFAIDIANLLGTNEPWQPAPTPHGQPPADDHHPSGHKTSAPVAAPAEAVGRPAHPGQPIGSGGELHME